MKNHRALSMSVLRRLKFYKSTSRSGKYGILRCGTVRVLEGDFMRCWYSALRVKYANKMHVLVKSAQLSYQPTKNALTQLMSR